MTTITVIGGGSFGSAIANMLGNKGYQVQQWMRNGQIAAGINNDRKNKQYFPGQKLSPRINATTNIQQAVTGSALIFVSVPSKAMRGVAASMAPYLNAGQMLVSTAKGIESPGFKLMSQVLAEATPCQKIGALSGPNLAHEVIAGQLSGTVIASYDEPLMHTVQQTLSTPSFRVYANKDVYGVQLGGLLKNIYAIASGLLSAKKLGENTRSMFITRSLAEMSRFAIGLGAQPLTFLGLAGVGDLVATCSSPLSRNYQVGWRIGLGESLDEALNSLGQVAEGVNTLQIVRQKAQQMSVRMPIVEGLYRILFEGAAWEQVGIDLMSGKNVDDVEYD